MAKPQLENGYTQIANELLEHLIRMHLAPNQWQVLLCVIRKTYGFHKKVDYIANIQIEEATGLGKTVVSRALHDLVGLAIITKTGKRLGFQKDWQQWKGLAIQLTSKVSNPGNSEPKVSNIANDEELAISLSELAIQPTKVSSPEATQKIKDTIQKKPIYIAYPEFKNVNKMTKEEHQKLMERFGKERTKDMVESLSLYIASKGDKYKNHYATILSWEKKDRKEAKGGENRRHPGSRRLPTTYRSPEEIYGGKDD